MALANYIKVCAKNTPGNQSQFYVAPTGSITALAETSGEISTLTAAADAFKTAQGDIDSIQFTQEGTFSTSGAYTRNLIVKFSKPSTELNDFIDALIDNVACGLEVIWVDGNQKVWLAGVTIDTKEGSSRPFNKMTTSLDTGVTITDEGLNADTITLTQVSGYRPVELDSTLAAAVLDGTATYIDWPA